MKSSLTIRASLLNTFQQCPRKACLSFHNPSPSTPAQDLGTRTHAQVLASDKTGTVYLQDTLGFELQGVLRCEKRYNRKIPNTSIEITGGIDAHDDVCVYDLKTTKGKPSDKKVKDYLEQPQTVIYGWLLAGQKKPLRIQRRVIVNQEVRERGQKIFLGKVVHGAALLRPDMQETALELALDFARMLKNGGGYAKPNIYCKYCPFFDEDAGCYVAY